MSCQRRSASRSPHAVRHSTQRPPGSWVASLQAPPQATPIAGASARSAQRRGGGGAESEVSARGRHGPPSARARIRREVWEACQGRCVYCAELLSRNAMTLDHVLPRARGGRNARSNLVAACEGCNTAKGDAAPRDWWTGMPEAAVSFLLLARAAAARLRRLAARALAALWQAGQSLAAMRPRGRLGRRLAEVPALVATLLRERVTRSRSALPRDPRTVSRARRRRADRGSQPRGAEARSSGRSRGWAWGA